MVVVVMSILRVENTNFALPRKRVKVTTFDQTVSSHLIHSHPATMQRHTVTTLLRKQWCCRLAALYGRAIWSGPATFGELTRIRLITVHTAALSSRLISCMAQQYPCPDWT
jgi:hypothetical protein